jgi:hypothetical protein
MKTLKGLILGVCVTGFVVLLSSASFAEGKQHKMDLGVIKSAAAALQATQPALAAGLTKYADDEAKEDLEKKDSKAEKEGVAEEKEEKEMKGQHEATIKLFKDSAAALKATHPDLAASLTKSAEWKEKRLKEKKEGKEDSEKDEAKEMKVKK